MPTRLDAIRAAVMLVITNVVTVLVLGDIVDWSAELTAGIVTSINSITLLIALMLPPGGTPATAQGAEKI